jgi:hypothetical protein
MGQMLLRLQEGVQMIQQKNFCLFSMKPIIKPHATRLKNWHILTRTQKKKRSRLNKRTENYQWQVAF